MLQTGNELKKKPTLEQLQGYLQEYIPGCNISQTETDEIRELYDSASLTDIRKIFKQAVRARALQPISYMFRQLLIIRPPKRQINEATTLNTQLRTYTSSGKSIEHSKDWNTVYDRLESEREEQRQEYDRQHGKGAWKQKEKDELNRLHNFFAKIETESDKKAQSRKEKYCESKEDKEWLDNLMKELAK